MAKAFIHDQTSEILEKKANTRLTINCRSGSKVDLMSDSEIVNTAVVNDSGTVVFSGLTQGEYVVVISNGELIEQRRIDVVTDYEISIDYITTTINVTYPAGSACEIKLDEYNCYTAPDTSGVWKCVVPLKGPWTVTCTSDNRVETKIVEVTDDDQFFNVSLEFFDATAEVTYPVGFVCTCTNGVRTFTAPDTSGHWSRTIPDRGEWFFTCTKDVRTRTITEAFEIDGESVNVDLGTYVGTIQVVYDAGYSCSLTCGNEVHTAPDTSGIWECSVYSVGEYTATCTNGIIDKTKTVVTSDKEPCSTAVNLTGFKACIRAIIPDGYSSKITYPSGSTDSKEGTAGVTSHLFYINATGTYTVECWDVSDPTSTVRTQNVNIASDWEIVTVNLGDFQATIEVTYPENSICTCTDGSTTIYAPDMSGSWTVTVPAIGTWTITTAYAYQTGTATVEIETYGQNERVALKFFSATIDITYPAGAKCTSTDGTTTFTAPDTSGRWTLKVPRAGEWLIRAVEGDRNVTESVEITIDEQYVGVNCEFFVAYINVIYPAGANKVVLWYVNYYGTKVETGVDTSGAGSHTFEARQVGTYEIGVYRVDPYVGIESSARDYTSNVISIDSHKQTVDTVLKYDTLPKITYTGTYRYTDDLGNEITESDGDWNIQFLTSGALKFLKLNGASDGIDVFVVGGGGNGGEFDLSDVNNPVDGWLECASGGGGGGGGYQETSFGEMLDADITYVITIGGSGGSSSAFGTSANGGSNGENASSEKPGRGGSGGSKGGDGGLFYGEGYTWDQGLDGEDGKYAFMGNIGIRYGAGGGGGGTGIPEYIWEVDEGRGGADGAGDGGRNALSNSGGGGGGGTYTIEPWGGIGGSGIVIIRNKR